MAAGFLFLVALAALMLLGGAIGGGTIAAARQQQVTAPGWLSGRQVTIPDGLSITSHAKKHVGEELDAWQIYALLLQGQCVASARYCRSDGTELYLCVDPVTGLMGGLMVLDDVILTGYGSGARYWGGKVRGQNTPFRAEFCYVH